MTRDIRELRDRLGLHQSQMAEKMGLSTRAYQDLEADPAKVRKLHWLAAERVSLDVAAKAGNPMLAELQIRREALEIARLIAG
jgi:transcriptional regulator with XRE-family HTH domain